jgi:hypothetical protein
LSSEGGGGGDSRLLIKDFLRKEIITMEGVFYVKYILHMMNKIESGGGVGWGGGNMGAAEDHSEVSF